MATSAKAKPASSKGQNASVDKTGSEVGAAEQDRNQPGFTLIKGVSEAIFLATASCIAERNIGTAIKENLHPCNVNSFELPETKLMINLLVGGKAAGSAVRYSRFYLIVDPYANTDINITHTL